MRYFLVYTILLIEYLLVSCENDTKRISYASAIPEISFEKETTTDNYGIDTTLYEKISGRIRRNQFLSEILEDYQITYQQIDMLFTNSADVFDARKMRSGTNYTLYLKKDSSRLDYMVYKHELSDHYLLDFTGEPIIRHIERPVINKLKYAKGTITTSLWNSMTDGGYNPILAVELSEIYAWSIDFFGLQKGDRFKVIYEEGFIEDESVGITRVYAALFEHAGNNFYAIPLIQDNKDGYYDLEGNSLRKAFLKAPLRYSRISSGFSASRMHPILRIRRPHHGVDYAAPVGTPVHAIGDGKVIMKEYQSGSGRIIKIRHNSVYTTAYMHLSRYGNGISVGKYVKQGDIIGYVGSSGLSTGPHLDFRFYKNGYAVDPLKVKAPPVKPVTEENLEKFIKIRDVAVDLLNSF